jgi:hypothetical protein
LAIRAIVKASCVRIQQNTATPALISNEVAAFLPPFDKTQVLGILSNMCDSPDNTKVSNILFLVTKHGSDYFSFSGNTGKNPPLWIMITGTLCFPEIIPNRFTAHIYRTLSRHFLPQSLTIIVKVSLFYQISAIFLKSTRFHKKQVAKLKAGRIPDRYGH